jgi:hypothetical protein
VANMDRCALGPPGAVLGPPYRVGGNRGHGADTSATLPPALYRRLGRMPRIVGNAGCDGWAIAAGLAGGQIGRWARWKSSTGSLKTGEMRLYRKPR